MVALFFCLNQDSQDYRMSRIKEQRIESIPVGNIFIIAFRRNAPFGRCSLLHGVVFQSNVIKLSYKSSERATSIAHGQRPVSETSPHHY
ncbi:MAG: hypothetical protein LBL13_01585 [Bacteroidales bacterium]|nr:hypothetical protein [Bacteroidales bacterium]